MSNPYGGPPEPPGGPEPGQSAPYQPYGAPNPYGAPAPATGHGVDAVSITGFVLSLLCCTSLIGLVLGIVGISRTKNGVRSGRWAAVSAIIIGAVGTLAGAGVLGFFIWFGTSTVTLSGADVGQCVNVDDFSDSNDATLFKKDCDESHDAEIVVADEFDSDQIGAFDEDAPAALCEVELDDEYAAAFATGDYDLDIVFEAQEPDSGDDFVCYLERADGRTLQEPIVG
jgi:hypothetical protein